MVAEAQELCSQANACLNLGNQLSSQPITPQLLPAFQQWDQDVSTLLEHINRAVLSSGLTSTVLLRRLHQLLGLYAQLLSAFQAIQVGYDSKQEQLERLHTLVE